MNIFDILGPVMVGPSSSHTAGAARIGFIAMHLLQYTVEKEGPCSFSWIFCSYRYWTWYGHSY